MNQLDFRKQDGRHHRRRRRHRPRRRAAARGERRAVALWDRDAAALAAAKAALGGGTVTHALDVADADAVARAAEATAEALGGIDVLVCSAGITGPNTPTGSIRSTRGGR